MSRGETSVHAFSRATARRYWRCSVRFLRQMLRGSRAGARTARHGRSANLSSKRAFATFAECSACGQQMVDRPYLSIVAATRNDNHGGDLNRRSEIFINGLVAQANRFQLPVELILVEWNPPDDRPPLREAFSWPEPNPWCKIRIITVPPSIHRRYRYSDRLPMFQMIAKNVGVRRARGDFILQTNVDVIFSDELFEFLAKRRLLRGVLYRCDRVDVDRDVPRAHTSPSNSRTAARTSCVLLGAAACGSFPQTRPLAP